MKTVSGEIISSKSISLKKAARTLSKFSSSDKGASPAFAAYLSRASASFNELVQLYKESKLSASEQPSRDVSEGTYESSIKKKKDNYKNIKSDEFIDNKEENASDYHKKRKKNKIKKMKSKVMNKERRNEGKTEIETNNNKESRKRKHESVVERGLDGSREQHKSKKKKR